MPWAFARLCAAALGVTTADEAPLGFLRSSGSPSFFWRHWHVSWYRWLSTYVYRPLGASSSALVAALACSTLLHGAGR